MIVICFIFRSSATILGIAIRFFSVFRSSANIAGIVISNSFILFS